MAVLRLHLYLTALGFWMTQQSSSFLLPNATELLSPPGGRAVGLLWGVGVPRSRRKRYLSPRDMSVILDYHNQVRAQVTPPAANMAYMNLSIHSGRYRSVVDMVKSWHQEKQHYSFPQPR
ncbi:PREDICTED: peptidase inhibitor R3HDML-like, partial [Fulmarus glacialis]|uniref:peptidase inhibitor R3HDML-like n=1 Tax=Fulmarus glacialis TaxID=30455 RepID=UPI00051BC239